MKRPEPEDEFRSALFVIIQIHSIPPRDHAAFAFANSVHVDGEFSLGNAELFTPSNVRRDLGAMNDVLARQACNVRTRSADISTFNYGDALSLRRECPGSDR